MRRLAPLAAGLLALGLAPSLPAQQPFDMSPELHLRVTPEAPPEPDVPAPDAESDAPPVHTDRHLLPGTGVRFEGEMGWRAFDVHLTEAQAAAPARLNLSALNAIVVAPEYSRFDIAINGNVLGSAPIEFSAAPSALTFDVPEGVLVPGRNRFEIDATQRHRTDCSVSSTYELWSELYSPSTFLRFEGGGLGRVTQIADLPAIGLARNGATRLRFLMPETGTGSAAALDLVQKLALATRSTAVDIEFIDALDGASDPGTLTIVLATAARLPAELDTLRAQAEAGPLAGFVPRQDLPNTLVVSGPDWAGVSTALDAFEGQVPSSTDLGGWRIDLPDSVPLITGRADVSLASLGVDTVEFNGRRYHTELRFSLPDDFFASMYSQAELILDAAYSAAVLPGSQLDIYVNGRIAAGVPILRTEGGTFRNSRLPIPMTNFRPGINTMHIETVLLTREDEVCPPGLSGRAANRFLLSADTRLAFPDFGRVGQYPNLAALAGTGAPYAGSGPVPVALADTGPSLDAAMVLLSRLAIESGRVVDVEIASPQNLDPSRNALVVGPMAALGPGVLTRGGIVELGAGGRPPAIGTGSDALERWREASGAASENLFERMGDWVADQLDLRPENFWLIRRADGAYLPQSTEAAILSQTHQDEGGFWTVLTIPDAHEFAPATRRLAEPAIWSTVAGRVSAIAAADDRALVLAPQNTTLIPTQPFSFSNARLVATNWLSINVLGYAVVLASLAFLLTLATVLVVRRTGRRS